jgi:hypothetical protein
VTHDLAYDLVEANGKVVAVGQAAYFGSAFDKHLIAPIIALVPTPDRKGYWLIGADGSVYPFGDARNEGGAGGKVRPPTRKARRFTTQHKVSSAELLRGFTFVAFGSLPACSKQSPRLFTGEFLSLKARPWAGSGLTESVTILRYGKGRAG